MMALRLSTALFGRGTKLGLSLVTGHVGLKQGGKSTQRLPCANHRVHVRGAKTKPKPKPRFSDPRLREPKPSPWIPKIHSVGQYFAMGSTLAAGGLLIYYGLFSNETGIIHKFILWPDVTKNRLKETFLYLGGAVALAIFSAVMVSQNQALVQRVLPIRVLVVLGIISLLLLVKYACDSQPYEKGFGLKQLLWVIQSLLLGLVMPAISSGNAGLIVATRAMLTAGCVTVLTALAAVAPSDKFLIMTPKTSSALHTGVNITVVAWILTPGPSVLKALLYTVAWPAGLTFFGVLFLNDVQLIVKKAESHADEETSPPFDPIRCSFALAIAFVQMYLRLDMAHLATWIGR